MIERYEDPTIEEIWSDAHKVHLWDKLELAVIKVRESRGVYPVGTHNEILQLLSQHPVDLVWWKKREEKTKHDLNAYLDERLCHLPQELHQFLHDGMTSYDTEELPFQIRLLESVQAVQQKLFELLGVLGPLAHTHRYTPMLGRTHGQEAKLQSFGKRVLTWIAQLQVDAGFIRQACRQLKHSKLSGAIGNYQGIDSGLEREVLIKFGFTPFYGATQIMPRNIHASLADALARFCMTLAKIAEDIRLNARSGHPIMREPFGKAQKGSSAMPHKKNTIATEQMIGMARMANAKALAIRENIVTWEERDIAQSCVERVEWPDLFHVTCHMLKTLVRVSSGLVVDKEAMLEEVNESCGTFASEDAKDYLKKRGAMFGLTHEDAYRIIQLACFNLFRYYKANRKSLEVLLIEGILKPDPELEADEETIRNWNGQLRQLMQSEGSDDFPQIFGFEYQLRGEEVLFQMIGGHRDPLVDI